LQLRVLAEKQQAEMTRLNGALKVCQYSDIHWMIECSEICKAIEWW
jgi:hypothetical protein